MYVALMSSLLKPWTTDSPRYTVHQSQGAVDFNWPLTRRQASSTCLLIDSGTNGVAKPLLPTAVTHKATLLICKGTNSRASPSAVTAAIHKEGVLRGSGTNSSARAQFLTAFSHSVAVRKGSGTYAKFSPHRRTAIRHSDAVLNFEGTNLSPPPEPTAAWQSPSVRIDLGTNSSTSP